MLARAQDVMHAVAILPVCSPVVQILDEHLGKLAPEHLETKFVKLNAEKSPFLTQKFNIRMLPTMALVKGGKVVDYVVRTLDSLPQTSHAQRLGSCRICGLHQRRDAGASDRLLLFLAVAGWL